jgi:hypothetical protein
LEPDIERTTDEDRPVTGYSKTRVILLVVVAILMLIGVIGMSVRLLPDAPVSPTPTFPKAIDFPNGRPVPHR